MRLEYPPAELAPRYGHGRPEHTRLSEILARGEERYRQNLRELLAFEDDLRRIPSRPAGPGVPYWLNQWLPGLDGIALYGFTRSRAPRRYLEVGSGLSTMFVRQAIRDGGLDTKVTSVDPAPRAEVDELCDELIRSPLETTDLAAFRELEAGDVVFFDGSHRVLMNSDVTVFFLEVLPQLPAGVLVGDPRHPVARGLPAGVGRVPLVRAVPGGGLAAGGRRGHGDRAARPLRLPSARPSASWRLRCGAATSSRSSGCGAPPSGSRRPAASSTTRGARPAAPARAARARPAGAARRARGSTTAAAARGARRPGGRPRRAATGGRAA